MGPMAYVGGWGSVDPAECAECLEAFLREITLAMEGWKHAD